MDITVILCTYNRYQSLAKALDSVALSQLEPATSWEVLVVDNNSNDRTREVTEDFCRRYPGRFRYVFEGHPGKSHALNAGIGEARGDVLAFMDDDVTVDSNWLQNLTDPLLRGSWVGAGGRVFPERDVHFPDWIRLDNRFTVGPLVMFDLGPEAAPLKEAPFGTNMAFHKKMFEKHGGFRTDLGPQPGSEIRGEDSEFVSRLLLAAEPLLYEPSAVVYHAVSENRLRKQYFLAWWFDKGRSDIRMLGSAATSKWSVAGIPLVLFRRLLVWTLKWTVYVGSSERFIPKLTVWYLAGEIVESYRRARHWNGGKNKGEGYQAQVSLAADPCRTGASNERQF